MWYRTIPGVRASALTYFWDIPAKADTILEIRAVPGAFVRVSLSSVALLTGTHRGVPFRLNFAWRVCCLPVGMAGSSGWFWLFITYEIWKTFQKYRVQNIGDYWINPLHYSFDALRNIAVFKFRLKVCTTMLTDLKNKEHKLNVPYLCIWF